MKFEIFKVVIMWIMVFWIVMSCTPVGGYQHFTGIYLLYLKIFSFISVSNNQFPLKFSSWQTRNYLMKLGLNAVLTMCTPCFNKL